MLHEPYPLQRYLQDVAGWVWREQDDALHYGLKLQEETLTEILLLRMARECSSFGLSVKMFNRIEEGGSKKTGEIGNGADWEWFIETPYCQVGFRVQAKVLSSRITQSKNLSVGNYEGLKNDRQQTNDLIKNAKAGSFNPIYVFYNHPWVADRVLFSSVCHPYSVSPTDWGCSVATANFIQRQSGNRLSTLIGGMLPWHRFFGISDGCIAEQAMSKMAGEQDFVRETPPPEWLYYMSDGPYAMDEYLTRSDLAGVAHFKLEN